MANYTSTTASEGGKLTDEAAVSAIISAWHTGGEVTAEIDNGHLYVCGYDGLSIYESAEACEEGEDEITEQKLRELCTYIDPASPLIIKIIGSEKCRYVTADAWIITSGGVEFCSIDDAVNAVLGDMRDSS